MAERSTISRPSTVWYLDWKPRREPRASSTLLSSCLARQKKMTTNTITTMMRVDGFAAHTRNHGEDEPEIWGVNIHMALSMGLWLDDTSIVDTAGRPIRGSLFDIWESTKDELLLPSSTSKGKIYVGFRKAYFHLPWIVFWSFSSRQRFKTAWGISKVLFADKMRFQQFWVRWKSGFDWVLPMCTSPIVDINVVGCTCIGTKIFWNTHYIYNLYIFEYVSKSTLTIIL